ncbi:MAG: DNA translocase FtsK 4TM domain-containing protein, partial [Anaerolineae bacterium]|nr:DNA translocase FtsK 4TM domain-containing protein [Anaerolineae bacterium]
MAKLKKRNPKTQQVVVIPTWLHKLRERGIWGILLLALSAVTLIGLFNRTSGTLIDLWSNLLLKTFGWGGYGVVLVVIILGLLAILNRLPNREALPWQVIVGTEMVFVLVLGLVHLIFFDADPWQAAQAGSGGGLVGAVFSAILSEWVGPWLTGAILSLALLGTGVFMAGLTAQELLELLEDWALIAREKIGVMIVSLFGRPTKDKAEINEPAAVEASAVPQAQPISQTTSGTQMSPAPPRSRRFKIELPPLTLLSEPVPAEFNQADAERKAKIIEETLAQFGVPAQVVEKNWGPRVTQFGIEPGYVTRRDQSGEETERKIRVSKIASLSNDLALALAASPIRIEAPVPGRSIIGIEVPNDQLAVVPLRQVLESRAFRRGKSALTLALGNGVAG